MTKGKIYRLSNGEKHYYGSTTQSLSSRLSQHLHSSNDNSKNTSKLLFDNVEYEVSIDLMEEIDFEDKKN